jgi:hypothetical protein
MSTPTQQDLMTLRFAQSGAPAPVIVIGSVNTTTLSFAWQGAPVVVTSTTATGSGRIPVVFVAM